jgi:hypothetical protein
MAEHDYSKNLYGPRTSATESWVVLPGRSMISSSSPGDEVRPNVLYP